jgi:hypothetical protein
MSAISAMLSPSVILSEVRVNARASRRTPVQPLVTMPIQGVLTRVDFSTAPVKIAANLANQILCVEILRYFGAAGIIADMVGRIKISSQADGVRRLFMALERGPSAYATKIRDDLSGSKPEAGRRGFRLLG